MDENCSSEFVNMLRVREYLPSLMIFLSSWGPFSIPIPYLLGIKETVRNQNFTTLMLTFFFVFETPSTFDLRHCIFNTCDKRWEIIFRVVLCMKIKHDHKILFYKQTSVQSFFLEKDKKLHISPSVLSNYHHFHSNAHRQNYTKR